MNIKLEEVIKKYGGKWIALNKDLSGVVVSGKDARRVYSRAKNKGYKTPTLFKVPVRNMPYIG